VSQGVRDASTQRSAGVRGRKTRARGRVDPDVDIDERSDGSVAPDDVPRLVAWLRSERPDATAAEVATLLSGVVPSTVWRLEQVLDDLASGCRPPSPADLAALTELDDLLSGERGP
jgi:hypothetical protein